MIRNLSSAVPRRAASFQVGVGCPQRFCSEISLRESSVYGCQADSALSRIFQQPPHHQTGNYISQNLLPCRVCGIRVCLREELWEGRSEAEATSSQAAAKVTVRCGSLGLSHPYADICWAPQASLYPCRLTCPFFSEIC